MVKGRLRISREGAITIVRVNDIYLVEDAELALIDHELHEHLNAAHLRVLIDMKNVKRMSSQAAEMFANLPRLAAPKGSRLAFCRLRPEFEHMLRSYPVTQDLPTFGDKPKALTAKW